MKGLGLRHMRQVLARQYPCDMRNFAVDLNFTINSGQVFLWDKIGDTWYGIDGSNLLVVKEPFDVVSRKGEASHFFRSDDNMKKILSEICRDKIVARAVRQFPGLRLVRQDPFQCYISFICSSNSTIQNIRRMLKNLCSRFGDRLAYEGGKFFSFPSPGRLARATSRDLLSCGLGFRAKYVREAAKNVESGRIDFEYLREVDYQTALDSLKKVHGIGNKIADCILLFSLDKLESFPIDRWTQRILQKYYPEISDSVGGKTLTGKKYMRLHEKIADYFGPYAGYSQQFLFKLERDLNEKKWL